jgi:hypothetical protein
VDEYIEVDANLLARDIELEEKGGGSWSCRGSKFSAA